MRTVCYVRIICLSLELFHDTFSVSIPFRVFSMSVLNRIKNEDNVGNDDDNGDGRVMAPTGWLKRDCE